MQSSQFHQKNDPTPTRLRRAGRLTATLAAIVVGIGLAASARAQATFAQFDESTNSGTEPFTFTNNGTSATFSGTVMGNFTFLLPGLPTGPQSVTITLTSTALNPATAAGPFLFQPIDGGMNTISFTRVSDGANLLTVTFTGTMSGFDGDNSATLGANTAFGDTVNFSSDFLDFSATTARNMSLTESLDPAYTQNANGFLDDFTADLTGGFSATPNPLVVPEPGSIALVSVGALGLIACGRRRRRAG